MIEKFQKLGLTYYESRALVAIIEGPLTPKELARKAQIPPGKVYSVIRALEFKRLAAHTASRPKRVFVESVSAALQPLLERKQVETDSLLVSLRDMATRLDVGQARPPRFFEAGASLEDNLRLQLRFFVEAKSEVCQILSIHHQPAANREQKLAFEREIGRAVARGVRFRAIYPMTCTLPALLERLRRAHPKIFQVRRLDTDFVRCDVADRRKVLIKLVHPDIVEFSGLVYLEHDPLARALQRLFERLWLEGGSRNAGRSVPSKVEF